MKRTLALVLALVMVIGMMAVPASASFTDDKEIKYVEAVDVVAAAGIINGFEDGSFDPDGTLTREQAAKVVAYMLLGAKNADALKASSAPFADVAANRWSAGYIAFVANEGIINGRDDKTFDPTGKVTAFEFAKLMLGALGYDSSIEQYTGAAWSINVGKTALDIGLFDGNDGADYNAPATREEAALYVFNTLQADLVAYDEKGSNIDLGNGIIINTGASKAEPAPVRGTDEWSNIKDEDEEKFAVVQFAERYFKDLEKGTGDADAFMRPATQWTYDGEDVGTYADEADEIYTAKVKGEQIYKDLGKPSASKTVYNYYLNGVKVEASELPCDSGFTGIAADMSKKVGGNGVSIEVYKVDPTNDQADDGIKNVYDVVVITTYVGTIDSWKAAKGAADEYVTVGTVEGAKVPDSFAGKYETEAFSEDDVDDETVVLYTFSQKEKEIQSVVAAESATGIVTATKGSDGFTLSGTSYKYAWGYESEVAYDADEEDEINVYLDEYGYVIYTDSAEDSNETYFLVVDTAEEGNWSKKTYSAKVVFPGTDVVEIVTLKNEESYNKLKDANLAIAEYTSSKDKYTIGEVTLVDDTTVDISTGKASMTVGDKITGNSKTEFLFVKSDDDIDDYKYTSYTGIKNVPDAENKTGTVAAYVENSDNAVALVVVVDAKTTSTGSVDDVLFVYGNTLSKLQKNADYEDGFYTVKAYNITSDEEIELMLDPAFVGTDKDDVANFKADNYFINGYYTTDGLVDDVDVLGTDLTAIDEFATLTDKTFIKTADGNVKMYEIASADGDDVKKGDEINVVEYGIDEDANVFYVNTTDKTVDMGSISGLKKTTDMVDYTVVINEDELVVAVYVFEA
ncbi:MAG: S-layer homology domain-containing protein [Candidatus Heteroscillospira sp.]|jgi:hypothetical protein